MTSTYSRGVVFFGFGTTFSSIQDFNLNLNPSIEAPNNWENNFTTSCNKPALPAFVSFQESLIKLILDILDFDIDYNEGTMYGELTPDVIEQ